MGTDIKHGYKFCMEYCLHVNNYKCDNGVYIRYHV